MTTSEHEAANGVKYTLHSIEGSDKKRAVLHPTPTTTRAELSAARWELSKRDDVIAIGTRKATDE